MRSVYSSTLLLALLTGCGGSQGAFDSEAPPSPNSFDNSARYTRVSTAGADIQARIDGVVLLDNAQHLFAGMGAMACGFNPESGENDGDWEVGDDGESRVDDAIIDPTGVLDLLVIDAKGVKSARPESGVEATVQRVIEGEVLAARFLEVGTVHLERGEQRCSLDWRFEGESYGLQTMPCSDATDLVVDRLAYSAWVATGDAIVKALPESVQSHAFPADRVAMSPFDGRVAFGARWSDQLRSLTNEMDELWTVTLPGELLDLSYIQSGRSLAVVGRTDGGAHWLWTLNAETGELLETGETRSDVSGVEVKGDLMALSRSRMIDLYRVNAVD